MPEPTELWINGVQVTDEEFMQALDESQERMIEVENNIREAFGVSPDTASAIFYLRGRSRWTEEKEQELIDRDKAGNPISLGDVLSGEF